MELILFAAIIDYIEKNYYEFCSTFNLEDFKQLLLNYILIIIDSNKNQPSLLPEKAVESLPECVHKTNDELTILEVPQETSEDKNIYDNIYSTKTVDIIKNEFKGATITVLVNNIGIISGEVVFNIENVLALKLSSNIIVFINNNAISGFY